MSSLYNRISMRSPARKKNAIQKIPYEESKPVNKPILEIKKNLYDRNSGRRTIYRKNRESQQQSVGCYQIVTQTPSGKETDIPTVKSTFLSFIKYKDPKPVPTAAKMMNADLLLINHKKRYTFKEALEVYENNQWYYLLELQKGDKLENRIEDIRKLEKWFSNIPEPKPTDLDELEDWKERQVFKKQNGYSKYFDQELLEYLNYQVF